MEFCEGGALQTRCYIDIETIEMVKIVKTAGNIILNSLFITVLLSRGIIAAMAQEVPQAIPQPAKKEIPRITFKSLSPPFTDYDYFQGYQEYPFQVQMTAFSLINAWWLAEASTLVYADEAFVKKRFTEAGLRRVIFFNQSSTQCFIASNRRFAILSFRGSEIWKRKERFDPSQIMADFKTNIDIRLSDWIGGGKVHAGFKSALDGVWDEMLPELKRLQDQKVPLWVTGHSLGAALATLAADRLQDVQGLYTFGSPRVGNQEFQKRFSRSAFRVVNGRDIVADVPPQGLYRHIGVRILIDQMGRVQTGCPSADQSNAASGLTDANASESAGEVKESGSAPYIPAMIRDHVPMLYCVYLWNELVDHLIAGQGG